MKMQRSHNSYKNCRIKMAGKYDQRPIILLKYESYQTNDLRELHPQSDAGQTNKRTNQKLYAPILSYAGHENPTSNKIVRDLKSYFPRSSHG